MFPGGHPLFNLYDAGNGVRDGVQDKLGERFEEYAPYGVTFHGSFQTVRKAGSKSFSYPVRYVNGGGSFEVPEIGEKVSGQVGCWWSLLPARWVSWFLSLRKVRVSSSSCEVLSSSSPWQRPFSRGLLLGGGLL